VLPQGSEAEVLSARPDIVVHGHTSGQTKRVRPALAARLRCQRPQISLQLEIIYSVCSRSLPCSVIHALSYHASAAALQRRRRQRRIGFCLQELQQQQRGRRRAARTAPAPNNITGLSIKHHNAQVPRAAIANRAPAGLVKPPPQLMASRVRPMLPSSCLLPFHLEMHLHFRVQNVMRSSSDEDITMDAQQFVHLPHIMARSNTGSSSTSGSPSLHGPQQPLQGIARTPSQDTRTPPSHDLSRFGAGGSGGSKFSPSFGQQQQRPTSAIRLASLNHTPTFKQTSPKDDGDDSRFAAAAVRCAPFQHVVQALELIVAAWKACAVVKEQWRGSWSRDDVQQQQ
jgi:hypothetical protein